MSCVCIFAKPFDKQSGGVVAAFVLVVDSS